MFLLNFLGELPALGRFILDASLLTISISVILYLLIIRSWQKQLSEQKQSDKEHENTEAHFRSMVESVSEAIISINSQGNIYFWNSTAEVIFGHTAEQVIGKSVAIIMPVRFRKRHQDAIRDFIANGNLDLNISNMETSGLRQDGTEFPLELSLSSVSIDEKVFFTGIIRDITERKSLEEKQRNLTEAYQTQYKIATEAGEELENALSLAKRAERLLQEKNEHLEAANRTKNEFLARMSHEIRTPIHSVMGMLELASETDLNEEQREYLNTAMSSSESLLSVINNVLDFSKIAAGHLEVNERRFNLRATVEKVVEMIAPHSQKKSLELVCDFPENVPETLSGDEARLSQVLINLAYNAVKFTETGEVVIGLQMTEEDDNTASVLFSVRDTGIGIPVNMQDSVFDAFVQADGSDTRRHGGTGLGLAISKQLVELMGGRIWVESQPEKGSTFNFNLTFKKEEAPEPPPPPAEWKGLKVLVIEDNRVNRRVLRDMLSSWGFEVAEASDAGSGIAAIGKAKLTFPFHLALIDTTLPDTDGITTAVRIASDSRFAETSVISLLSGHAGADVTHFRESGLKYGLSKPIKRDVLREKLKAVLGYSEESPDITVRETKEPAAIKNINVLIADDNATSQTIGRKSLMKRGYKVFSAEDGYEVLKILGEFNIDIVLMDVEMPQMNGLEATRIIRRQEEGSGRHLPIIAMTAYAQDDDKQRCLEAGMDGYLSKPIKYEAVSREIDALLSREKADATESALDLDLALQLTDGDRELLSEAMDIFIDHDYPTQIDALRESLRQQDPSGVRAAAHGIKGAAANLGGKNLSQTAKEIEGQGKENDLAAAGETLAFLEREFEIFVDEARRARLLSENQDTA